VIFRAATYAILSATARCGACGDFTHVVAIAVPAAHEVFAGDAWEPGSSGVRLFYVESLPASVRQRLALLAPWYRSSEPRVVAVAKDTRDLAERGWGNHCEHCDAPLDDHDLHCEPDGAFTPALSGADSGAAMRVLRWEIREPLEVVAGGAGDDPAA
jgi:hypothetical protein